MLLIRAATVSNAPLLLRFFQELPDYERQPGAVIIRLGTLLCHLFKLDRCVSAHSAVGLQKSTFLFGPSEANLTKLG